MANREDYYKFALVKITTEQFAVIEQDISDDPEVNITVDFRFGADNNQELIAVFAAFSFEIEGKKFLIIEAGCHFNIASESWNRMLNSEKEVLKIPKKFLQHLAVITVGTARGMLHAKTENTDFNRFHLPTMNLQEMITEDSIFDFRGDSTDE